MKRYSTYFASLLLLITVSLVSLTAKADGGKSRGAKVFTRWELSPIADIYYRYEILKDSASEVSPKSMTVEFLNNYKKEVSFCFAINDNGVSIVAYKPVFNLKKKKTTAIEYPRPRENNDIKISITSVELGK